MPSLSTGQAARARKNEALILQRLASEGQAPVAEALEVSESTVSRFKDGDIARFARLLAVLGLKATPQEYKCYKPEYIEWLLQGARIGVGSLRSSNDLLDEEAE